jgi:hypothetical protein
MPVIAEYSDGFITLRLVGEYALSEMKDAFLAALPSSTGATTGVIIDVSQSTSVGARPPEEVRGMSRWWADRRALFSSRMALIATPGTVQYGMARLSGFEAERVGVTVSVFEQESEARAWISLGS